MSGLRFMTMSTLKNLLCCAVLLSPTTLVANTPLTVPVVVKIQVPNPGWKLQIDQVFNKGDEGLIVICSVKKNEGMHASVISEATDSVKIPANLTKIPLQVYVLGKDWNWGEGYTAIKKSDLKKITAGATAVYDSSQKKEVTKTDFIGLTLEVASKLAKDNKAIIQ